MKDFKDFIKKQGVINLAIGFVLGTSVSNVVKSLVNDIVSPIIGIFTGATDGIKNLEIIAGPATIRVGNFISVLLDFLIVAFVVFYTVKFLDFEKETKKK